MKVTERFRDRVRDHAYFIWEQWGHPKSDEAYRQAGQLARERVRALFRHDQLDPFEVITLAERKAGQLWQADGSLYGLNHGHWASAFFRAVLTHCRMERDGARLTVFFIDDRRPEQDFMRLLSDASTQLRRYPSPEIQVYFQNSVETMLDRWGQRQGNDHPLVACFCPMDAKVTSWRRSILSRVLNDMGQLGIPWHTDCASVLEVTADNDGVNYLDFSNTTRVVDGMLIDLLT